MWQVVCGLRLRNAKWAMGYPSKTPIIWTFKYQFGTLYCKIGFQYPLLHKVRIVTQVLPISRAYY